MLEHYCLATLSHIYVNDNCRFLQSGGAEVSSLHSELVSGLADFSVGSLCVPRVSALSGFSRF